MKKVVGMLIRTNHYLIIYYHRISQSDLTHHYLLNSPRITIIHELLIDDSFIISLFLIPHSFRNGHHTQCYWMLHTWLRTRERCRINTSIHFIQRIFLAWDNKENK